MPETVLALAVIVLTVFTTANVFLWAFRPGFFRIGPRACRGMGAITAACVIVLPVGGAVLLALGTDAVATGRTDTWQGIVTGAIAVACWPVTILALRKR